MNENIMRTSKRIVIVGVSLAICHFLVSTFAEYLGRSTEGWVVAGFVALWATAILNVIMYSVEKENDEENENNSY